MVSVRPAKVLRCGGGGGGPLRYMGVPYSGGFRGEILFIFFCLRRHFSFFALQKKGSLEAGCEKIFTPYPKILPAAPFIFLLRKQRSANASTGATGYRTPESTSLACARLPRGRVYAGT